MAPRPGDAERPRFDVADIVRAHRGELGRRIPLGRAENRVLSAIASCRTAVLGGHVDVCRSCGHEHYAYHSCRNRHCPKCQALAQEQWIAARARRLLPVRHFHVVFTLPAQLRPLCRHTPRAMYDALFQAANRTVLALAASRWRAVPGITTILHTWTRDLRLHPHIHMLVTEGGLALDGSRWISRRNYLFPIAMMATVFRAKMLDALRDLRAQDAFARCEAFDDPEAFDRLLAKLVKLRWVVYTKRPFRRAEYVLAYLGRYTHRVAISSSRLLAVSDAAVTFHTKGGQTATLHPVEFLRRFVQHVLPDGFKKIRHSGLYAAANTDTRWVEAHKLLTGANAAAPTEPPAAPGPDAPVPTWAEQLQALTGRDVLQCRRCGGPVARHPLARAPP